MSRRRLNTQRWWLTATMLLSMGCLNLGPIDCNGPPPTGGLCQVGNAHCPSGYYCALTETCTRPCAVDADCLAPCVDSTDNGGGCGLADTCDDGGFCASSRTMACIKGFCQGNCRVPASDGMGCEYDLYGPSEFDMSADGGS